MLNRRQFHKSLLASALGALAAPAYGVQARPDPARIALDRLTFGATPQALAAMAEMGLEGWIKAEIAEPPEDDALSARLADTTLLIEYEAGKTAQGAQWQAHSEHRPLTYLDAAPGDHLRLLSFKEGLAWEERIRPAKEVIHASLIRAVHAKTQLREVIVQFWHEHFSVNALGDEHVALYFPAHDRAIRAHALGNFRALLEASAKSPSMLSYLNNAVSRASPANENYARELMELHTLGAENYFNDLYDDWKAVPGAPEGRASGYIDQDVYEVARAFTGWSVGDGRWLGDGRHAPATGAFTYIDAWHDPYQKRILGQEFPAFAGPMSDGDRVLDLLAVHPGTARHIASKLLRRLGVETPSAGYLERITQRFLKASEDEDQIAQVVTAIALDEEFLSSPVQKLRRPFEFLANIYRKSGAELTAPRYNVHWWLGRTGWTQHHVRPPTGHSDHSADWANTSALNGMIDLALYAHDDWFGVAALDLATPPEGAQRWGDIARHWSARFGVDPAVGQAALSHIGAGPDQALPQDRDYLAWGSRTLITLSAVTPGGLFR